MTKKLFALVLLGSLLGCGQIQEDKIKTSFEADVAGRYNGKNAKEQVCTGNLIKGGSVATVCWGNQYSDDIIYRALFLKSSKAEVRSLIQLAKSDTTSNLGCANATRAKFVDANDLVYFVDFCYGANGEPYFIESLNVQGSEFRLIQSQ